MTIDLPSFVLGLQGPAQSLVMQNALPMNAHVIPRPGAFAPGTEPPPRVVPVGRGFTIHLSHAEETTDDRLTVYSSGWGPSDDPTGEFLVRPLRALPLAPPPLTALPLRVLGADPRRASTKSQSLASGERGSTWPAAAARCTRSCRA